MVVGALTHRSLLHSVCDWKAGQMNVQFNLIQEHMLYKFRLGHITKATKNIYIVKGEGTIDYSTITR